MRPAAARPPLERAEAFAPRRLVGLAALVLLAFAVRVWGLADHSLWLDEAQLLVRAQSDLPTTLLGRTPLDLAPPLYPLLLHLWTRLGEPDFLLRFPSVAAGVLAVAVLSRLRPWPVGPLAALLYAVAPTQLHYAQEATPYALVGLLASAALVAAQTLKASETFRVSRAHRDVKVMLAVQPNPPAPFPTREGGDGAGGVKRSSHGRVLINGCMP